MISTTMATALNEQIKWEMYSANLYLAMSAYLQDAGLTGFAHWMRVLQVGGHGQVKVG